MAPGCILRSMSWTIFQVDSFTDRPFAGNPAGVCVLDRPAADDWMQAVATEMNVAETAFLVARPDRSFDLRWFTPAVEVDLCGHATLASAHVLLTEKIRPEAERAYFHTRSGLLTAWRDGDSIRMDFPAEPVAEQAPPPTLATALGVPLSFVGRNRMDWLVEVDDEATLRRVRPDMRALAALGSRGVIVTARAASPGADFVSRFFAPGAGIDEDPVTGSAHCALGPYWGAKLGLSTLAGLQLSARGGRVECALDGARVVLGGRAVTVLKATLL